MNLSSALPGLDELFQRIDAAKAQLDAMRPLDREREQRLMQKLRLWWTYHSNAIEGNSLTQGETEMFLLEGLTAKGKPLKDHLDLRGHSNAVNDLMEFVREKEVLTEAAIRELHKVLLVEPYRTQAITPDGAPTMKAVALGEYKTQPNHVRTPTGETHFYATPEDTPAEMHALLEWFRSETQRSLLHPVEIAARFHHRFTGMHPFDDGNGRMSRLLMNLMLMQSGYAPAVIRISERDQYLAALRRADQGEYDDFIGFIGEHVVESLELSLRAAKGEEIAEPTDIEKEIALEVLRLEHVEEPQPLTSSVQPRLVADSLDPLLVGIAKLITPLCALFAENAISITGSHQQDFDPQKGGFQSQWQTPISGLPVVPRSAHVNWTATSVFTNFQINFLYTVSRKQDSTLLTYLLFVFFERLKYRLEWQGTKPPFSIQHSYRDHLSNEEVQEVAQRIARFFLEAIKKKTASVP